MQHQLAQVTNFWRLGLPAEFHLVSLSCGEAELKLTFPLRSPSDLIPPSSAPNTAACSIGSKCLKKASRSQFLRRERRAAERAAAEKNAAKNSTEVKTDDKKVALKVDSEIAAAKKAVTETAAYKIRGAAENFEKATEKYSVENCLIGENGSMASTSCIASSQCVNCDGVMSAVHQCEVPPTPTPPSIVLAPKVPTEQPPAPLPLCHYCCHRGSGENPVHYYLQCLCLEKKCSCRCYCSEEQLCHRKLFYPQGYSDGNPVDPSDRPKAQAIGEAQADHRPCGSEHCVKPV